MPSPNFVVSLPIADRQTSYAFYRDGVGLDAVGDLAEDGVPEPLQFDLGERILLMLVPVGGFGWVIGNRTVAQRGISECILSRSLGSEARVDELFAQVQRAGAEAVTEPGPQPWGYAAVFADPDGHLWMLTAE